MSSVYWYCLLGVIGSVTVIVTVYKKRQITEFSNFVIFYLFATCIPWIGEFTVLGLFNAYTYKIGVWENPWAQNLFAHLILNSTLWPATATLVAAYSLGYGWISLFALANALIEFLFVNMGIYEQHWWRYYMTFIAVFIYMAFAKYWFKKMHNQRYGLVRAATLYFVAFVVIHYPIPLTLLFGKQYYNANWASDMYLSSIRFIFAYQLVEAFIFLLFICVLKKWYWKAIPIITAFIGQSILFLMNILIFKNGWNMFHLMLIYLGSTITLILLNKYGLKPRKESDLVI